MPCFECVVDEIPPKDTACHGCLQETSCCAYSMKFEDIGAGPLKYSPYEPCGPEACRLRHHGCRFQGPEKWETCGKHRDLPLDAKKDHYVCSEHLEEQLQLEERYPSVVMSKCAAPGCWGSRCRPVPGKNGPRYCGGHANNRYRPQNPTGWRTPRPQVIQALREAGLDGLPWTVTTAREYPAVAACYKTDHGALAWDSLLGRSVVMHAQGPCHDPRMCLAGLAQASMDMLLMESRWFPGTGRRNYWSLEGERRCTHVGPGGRCACPSEGAPLCAMHMLHSQADPLLATLLLCLRRTSEGGFPGRDRDFYGLLRSQKLSKQRAFLVSCLWS